MTPQKFRATETIEALRITDDNAPEIIEWCGGERAGRPGEVVALKSWANVWMLGTEGDWVARDRKGFRIIRADEFARNWERVIGG